MNIVIFSHPRFIVSQSMPRFANFLFEGLKSKGHNVEVWAPVARMHNYMPVSAFRKWFGYIDQYLIFPLEVRKKLKSCSKDTLFVFADNALGPWVPLVADRPHVIHCHDFLAQQSALGKITENPTSWMGRTYQSFIRAGYVKGKHFISVSKKTQSDLHSLLSETPHTSKVVYNGLNQQFSILNPSEARNELGQKIGIDLSGGYLLHVGGNQWYKNRAGVIALYSTWRSTTNRQIPLLLVGAAPTQDLRRVSNQTEFRNDIHFITGLDDHHVRMAYAGASLFLFPSMAEGFGWPIAEAMASGCPVVTTKMDPMTEVGGDAAFYIEPYVCYASNDKRWSETGSRVMQEVLDLPHSDHKVVVQKGRTNSARFNTSNAIEQIETIYKDVLGSYSQQG